MPCDNRTCTQCALFWRIISGAAIQRTAPRARTQDTGRELTALIYMSPSIVEQTFASMRLQLLSCRHRTSLVAVSQQPVRGMREMSTTKNSSSRKPTIPSICK